MVGMALRDIRTSLKTCQKSFCVTGARLLHRFQNMTSIFSCQAQHFGRLHLHFAWQARHFRHVVLCAFANRIVRAVSSSDNVQIVWQAWDIVRVSFCVAGAAFAAAPSCVECHSIWDTLHFTLYTLYTLHFTLYTLHFTLYTLYTLHFTLYTLHFALYTPHSTLYTPLSTLYTLHFTLHTLHFALYTPHSALCTLHSTLYKIDGRLARNIDFEVANCEIHEKIVRFLREFYEVFLSMCFDICAINIRVSIRVRRLHLVSYTVYASDVYVRYKSVCDWV